MRRRRQLRNDRSALLHAAATHLFWLDAMRRRREGELGEGSRLLEDTIRAELTDAELELVGDVVEGRLPSTVLGPDDERDHSLVELAGVRWRAGGWQPVGHDQRGAALQGVARE